jgi:hypothetical protein
MPVFFIRSREDPDNAKRSSESNRPKALTEQSERQWGAEIQAVMSFIS